MGEAIRKLKHGIERLKHECEKSRIRIKTLQRQKADTIKYIEQEQNRLTDLATAIVDLKKERAQQSTLLTDEECETLIKTLPPEQIEVEIEVEEKK